MLIDLSSYPSLVIQDGFQDNFVKLIKFAEEEATADQHKSLVDCLERLSNLAKKDKCHIYHDFAPLSFGWATMHLQGGCIFHGSHDNGGDGGAPTYSVCLQAVDGWSLHT